MPTTGVAVGGEARHEARLDATRERTLDAQLDAPLDARLDATHGTADHAMHPTEGPGAAGAPALLDAVLPGAGAPGGPGRRAERVAVGRGAPMRAGAVMLPGGRTAIVASPVAPPMGGPVALPSPPLDAALPAAPFDAPRELGLRPSAPAKERTPDLDRHAAVFAAAADAALRLHRQFADQATRIVAEAANAETGRAMRRQAALDRDLAGLGQALSGALGEVGTAAAAALADIAARAAAARRAIGGAAARATTALDARVATIEADLPPRKTRGDGIVGAATGRLADLEREGGLAAAAVAALASNPAAAFPAAEEVLDSAKNEAVASRIGTPARARAEALRNATTAFANAIRPAVQGIPPQLTRALSGLEGYKTSVESAKTSVTRQRDAAVAQVRETETELVTAVVETRAQAEQALVAQHDAARAQLAEAARQRALAEAAAAGQQAAQQGRAALGLAAAQATALRSVHAMLRDQRDRTPAEFATLVVRSADGLQRQLPASAANSAAALARAAGAGTRALDAGSETTSAQMTRSAAAIGTALAQGAAQTAEGLARTVTQGTAPFAALPRPIAATATRTLKPIETGYAKTVADLDTALGDLSGQVDDAFAGRPGRAAGGGEGSAGAAPAVTPPATTPAGGSGPRIDVPEANADAFRPAARRIAADAKTEERLASLATAVGTQVSLNVNDRVDKIEGGLGGFTTNVDMVMEGLRGLTARRGAAVAERYGGRNPLPLATALDRGMENTFSAPDTITHNKAAAQAYLAGNAAAGALAEMQAAVNLWNDEARVEAAQRSLTPAQMNALHGLPGAAAVLEDVRDDLDGADREVFSALLEARSEGAVATEAVGRANAIRLDQAVARAREDRGYRGGDATVDALRAAGDRAGGDRLSGQPEFTALESPAERERRLATAWEATLIGFGERAAAGEGADGRTGPPADPAAALERGRAALIEAATRERAYQVYVANEHGEGGHYETVREGIGRDHERLVDRMVRNGPNSEQARAAAMVVEMNRPGGRPDLKRFDLAVHDEALNPALAGGGTDAEERRAQALARRDRMFELYDQYMRENSGEEGPPRPAAAVREELEGTLRDRFQGNDVASAYAESLVADARGMDDDTREGRAARDAAAVAAFNFAVEGSGTDEEVLRRTFSRMTRDQVDRAVAAYNAAHPDGPSLYERLGLHGEGNWWTSELSGDERLEMERLSMGVPQNDRERAEVAALTARQQIRESGFMGRFLAGEEYGRLEGDYARLIGLMGVAETDFDSRGRIRVTDPVSGARVNLGHFNEDGSFRPPTPGSEEALEVAIQMSRLSAEAYTRQVDRIATAVTTALVVAAAIVTTAVTFGTAAAIWGPVLVTLGAGLAGMAFSAAVKGGRYGYEDAARDLALTVVQAATAGLGAAAAAGLRGGMPLVRAGASRVVGVSEKAAERLIARTSAQGLRQGLSLGEEAMIGGVSSMLNSTASTLTDDATWQGGRGAEEAGHSALRSFLGGAVGAGVMRPFGAAARANSAGLRTAGRSFGQGLSSSATRATEIGYEHARGRHRGSTASTVGEIFEAGLIGMAQGGGEARADTGMRGRAAARASPRRPTAAPDARAPPATPEASTRPVAAPDVAEAPGPGPRAAAPAEGEAEGARPAAAPAEPASLPPAARLAPTAGEAVAPRPIAPTAPDAPTGPRPAPRSSGDDDPTLEIRRPAPSPDEEVTAVMQRPGPSPDAEVTAVMPRPGPSPDEEVTAVMKRPAPSPDEEVTAVMQRAGPAPDDEVTTVMKRPAPAPDEEVTVVAKRPGPAPEEEVIDLTPGGKWAEGLPFIETDRAVAARRYGDMIVEDRAREVAIYVNRDTGEYLVVQGARATVPTAWLGSGRLHLIAHYHPNRPGSRRAGLIQRLPSGGDGDMEVVRFESAEIGGRPVRSRIHYVHEGRVGYTDFGHDPNSATARYWIEIDNPVTGRRERHEFASLDAYADWGAHVTGLPRDRFLARPPPAAPGPAAAGPDAPTAARPAAHSAAEDAPGPRRPRGAPARAPPEPAAEPAPPAAPDTTPGMDPATRRASDIIDEIREIERRIPELEAARPAESGEGYGSHTRIKERGFAVREMLRDSKSRRLPKELAGLDGDITPRSLVAHADTIRSQPGYAAKLAAGRPKWLVEFDTALRQVAEGTARTRQLEKEIAAARARHAELTEQFRTEGRVIMGVALDPRLPLPEAGPGYAPKRLSDSSEAHAQSHINGYVTELRLANAVVQEFGDTVIRYGNKAGVQHADVISVNAEGAVTMWDAKFRSAGSAPSHSETFTDLGRRQAAIEDAISFLQSGAHGLPPEVARAAIANLQAGTFTTITAHAGQAGGNGRFDYTTERYEGGSVVERTDRRKRRGGP